MRGILLLLVALLSIQSVIAGEMVLLAVQETSSGFEGGTAVLTLELQPGQGRVFLETAPLVKIDTQVSTRFAQQFACRYLLVDCSEYDFIYTIRSSSPIVGGPSAGATMAILTIAELEGRSFDRRVALTGTINAGGIIGPVGGLKEKIDAASKEGIKTVLIPAGETNLGNSSEDTNLISYGESIGVTVVEVDTLDAAIPYFFGSPLREEVEGELVIDPEYSRIMQEVAEDLCGRSYFLNSSYDVNVSSLLEGAQVSLEKGQYYSAASRCFNANIQLTSASLKGVNKSVLEYRVADLQVRMDLFEEELRDKERNTLPGLQTYMLVQERVYDANQLLENTVVLLEENDLESAVPTFAFAEERFSSAVAWSVFFEAEGTPLEISSDDLKNGCQIKLGEAEERLQYVATFYSGPLEGLQEDLHNARQKSGEGQYELCLNSASLVKARADTLIGTQGLSNEEQVLRLVETKLRVAEKQIIREQSRGAFPIAGFAYYEYAQSLKEESLGSALLFSQYALELSNLDPYFGSEFETKSTHETSYELFLVYLLGLLSGVVVALVFMRMQE